jgi:hypothetical protein
MGDGRREKGEGRREKGKGKGKREGRREKGEVRDKGEGAGFQESRTSFGMGREEGQGGVERRERRELSTSEAKVPSSRSMVAISAAIGRTAFTLTATSWIWSEIIFPLRTPFTRVRSIKKPRYLTRE